MTSSSSTESESPGATDTEKSASDLAREERERKINRRGIGPLIDHHEPTLGRKTEPKTRYRQKPSGRTTRVRRRSFPASWPSWPLTCDGKRRSSDWTNMPDGSRVYTAHKGDPCLNRAVPGSYQCRFHGGYLPPERLRMRRYLLFVLTGETREKAELATEMMVAAEINAILDRNRQGCSPRDKSKASDRVRAEILLAALKAGIIGPP